MKEGQWAMIAGSADGLGESFTTLLAAQGFNLVLIDRQPEALKKTAEKVEKKYRVKTLLSCIDLAGEDAWKICMGLIQETGCRIKKGKKLNNGTCRNFSSGRDPGVFDNRA